MTTEKLLNGIAKEYTKVMNQYMNDVEANGYSWARKHWDETIMALENIVEEFDLKLVYHTDTKTTTIEEY